MLVLRFSHNYFEIRLRQKNQIILIVLDILFAPMSKKELRDDHPLLLTGEEHPVEGWRCWSCGRLDGTVLPYNLLGPRCNGCREGASLVCTGMTFAEWKEEIFFNHCEYCLLNDHENCYKNLTLREYKQQLKEN